MPKLIGLGVGIVWGVLVVLIGAVTLAARAGDGEHAAWVREFLTPPAGCAAPCWAGIRPGETTSLETMARLQAIPAVQDIFVIDGIVTSDRYVRWRWDTAKLGAAAGVVDTERFGQVWIRRGVVYLIELPLRVGYSTLLNAYGPSVMAGYEVISPYPAVINHTVNYSSIGLEFESRVECPAAVSDVLSSRVTARVTQRYTTPPDFDLALFCRYSIYQRK